MSTKLIVGLGNPGRKYQKTRHNVGFQAIDFLAGKKTNWTKSKNANAFYARIEIKNQGAEVIKPQTFMNSSGTSVAYVAKKHFLKPQDIIVVYDELDLPFGEVRVRDKGSSAGHNGIKSIIEHLGSDEFHRIRIGISNEKREKMEAADFVLKKFSREERKKLKQEILPQVVGEIEKIIFDN